MVLPFVTIVTCVYVSPWEPYPWFKTSNRRFKGGKLCAGTGDAGRCVVFLSFCGVSMETRVL